MTTSSFPVVVDRPIENNSFRSKAIFKNRKTFKINERKKKIEYFIG